MPNIAVVTGANKGIGFAIVRSLCQKLDRSDVVYLTSRDESRGLGAIEKLKEEGLSPCYHQLDIGDEESVIRLKEDLEKAHGGIDILINNVGIASWENDLPFMEKVERTLKTNFFDTLKTYNTLSSILRSNSRVVFLASGLGHTCYRKISSELKNCFREAKSEDDVQKLMQKFISDVRTGNHGEMGWQPGEDTIPPYSVSKLGVITATKVLAENLKDGPRDGILINTCCPGFVSTDLNNHRGRRTIDEGAVTPVLLALIPRGSSQPHGKYMDAHQKIQDFLTE